MGFRKGIHKCVECEKKLKENPNDTGMCSKCGAAETRLEKTIYKELIDDGNFPQLFKKSMNSQTQQIQIPVVDFAKFEIS